jgi:hypothetical protein
MHNRSLPLGASWEVVFEHLARHRERCGVAPALVLRCECGGVDVLICTRCATPLLVINRSRPMCEHGLLLVEGGAL